MKQNAASKTIVLLTLCSSLLLNGCLSKVDKHTSEAEIFPTNATPSPALETKQTNLPDAILTLNGKELRGWQITDFGGHGEVLTQDGEIKIFMGAELTGISWTNAAVLPKTNYEIELDAMKVEGSDFFCGLTFPVSNSFCSLIVGGWGGGIVGISNINGADASENDTSRNLFFQRNRWYHIRVEVRPEKIIVWIDQDKVIDLEIEGRRISMRGGDIEHSVPFGIATWQTSTAIKNIKLRSI